MTGEIKVVVNLRIEAKAAAGTRPSDIANALENAVAKELGRQWDVTTEDGEPVTVVDVDTTGVTETGKVTR